MTKCESCGVNIEYSTSICPICGSAVECQDLPAIYPPKTAMPKVKIVGYKVVAAFVAFVLTVLVSVINYFVAPALPWSLPIVAIVIAIYLMMLMYNTNFSLTFRYAISLLSVLLVAVACGYTLSNMATVTEFVLPSLFLTFIVIINVIYWTTALWDKKVRGKKHVRCDVNKLMLATFYLSLTAIIPMINYGAKVVTSLPISTATLIIGVSCAALILLANLKKIKHIFTAYYHF